MLNVMIATQGLEIGPVLTEIWPKQCYQPKWFWHINWTAFKPDTPIESRKLDFWALRKQFCLNRARPKRMSLFEAEVAWEFVECLCLILNCRENFNQPCWVSSDWF
jgi:hypothetical protein